MMNIDRDRVLDDFPVLGYQLASRLEDWQHDGTLTRIDHLLVLLADATAGMTGEELRDAAGRFGRVLGFLDGLLQTPGVINFVNALENGKREESAAISGQDGDLIEVLEKLREPDAMKGLEVLISAVSALGRSK